MERRFQDARERLLGASLPTPAVPVDIGALVSFKERHDDTLQSFRRYLDGLALRIARAGSDWERDKEMDLLECELEADLRDARDEIEARMREKRWRVARIVVQLAAPFGGLTASVITGDPLPAIAASGVPALGEALLRMIERQSPGRPAPLAFAAAAQRELMV